MQGYNTNFDINVWAEQTRTRFRNICLAEQELVRQSRSIYTRDVKNVQLLDQVQNKIGLLANYVMLQNYTQKRINVTEQYLQELEVLLNLDL